MTVRELIDFRDVNILCVATWEENQTIIRLDG